MQVLDIATKYIPLDQQLSQITLSYIYKYPSSKKYRNAQLCNQNSVCYRDKKPIVVCAGNCSGQFITRKFTSDI